MIIYVMFIVLIILFFIFWNKDQQFLILQQFTITRWLCLRWGSFKKEQKQTTTTTTAPSSLWWGLAMTFTCRTSEVQNSFKPRRSGSPRTSHLLSLLGGFLQTRRHFTHCPMINSKAIPLLKRILCRHIYHLGYHRNNRLLVQVQRMATVHPIQILTELIRRASLDSLRG